MQTKNKKYTATLCALALMMVLSAAGCAGSSQPQPQMVYPTVVIVQYVTQVVATVTPAPPTTPVPNKPTEAPAAVAASRPIGYDPFSQPIYYPIKGCQVASRLHVGERVFVANGIGTIGLHMSKDIGGAPIFRHLEPGEVLDVIDGPYCQRLSLVWEVVDITGQKGFVPEGDGELYWLLPMGEKVAADLLKPTPDRGARLGLPAYCRPR